MKANVSDTIYARICKFRVVVLYISSSAVVLRWNLAWSSLGTDESTSFPLEKSIFPI